MDVLECQNSKKIDANSLYAILLRETENDPVQEVNPDLYTSISDIVGQLKSEGYDGVEAKVKDCSFKHDNRYDFTSFENSISKSN